MPLTWRFCDEVRGVRAPWATTEAPSSEAEASTSEANVTPASTAAGKRIVRSPYFQSHVHEHDGSSSEDDELPRSRQAVGGDGTIRQAGIMLDSHSRRRQSQRTEMRDIGGGVRYT